MRNFKLVGHSINTSPLMNEIQRQPDLWDEYTVRTKHPGTAHSQVSDILVWFNEIPKNDNDIFKLIDDREVIPYRSWFLLPSLRPIIFGLMFEVQAVRLGRVMITRLPVGKTITPHVDGGAPATYYQRYQIALQCLPGNVFKIDDEEVGFKTGEIWFIDNRKTHSVVNNSEDDRIVLIVDLRSE